MRRFLERPLRLGAGMSAALALTGCSPIFYAPDVPVAPLLRDEKDIRTSGHLGGGGEVDSAYQLNVAGAVYPHVGIYGSIYGANGSDPTSYQHGSGSGVMGSIAGGYFAFSEVNRVGFEALGGVALGRGHNSQVPDYRVDYRATKPFGQVNVGYRGRHVEAIFAQRIGHVSFSDIREAGLGTRPAAVSVLLAHSHTWLYEPALSFRVGSDPVKFGFDLSWSNASDRRLAMDTSMVAIGVYVTTPRK